MNHTPTPWQVVGCSICSEDETIYTVGFNTEDKADYEKKRANAAFIIRAVNAHDELVKLLHTRSVDNHHNNKHPGSWGDCDSDVCEYDKAAIAKAEGR